MAASKGVWFDVKSGKVVSSEPEEGVQLVAPGVEPTPDEQSRVDAYKALASGEPAAPVTVTSKSSK